MIAALIPLVMPLLERVFSLIPDAGARAKAQRELLEALMQLDTSQIEVNKAEAASGSLFVAGWRPMIGWACASALTFQYLLVPIGLWLGFVVGYPIPKPPTLDEHLWELMLGILGLGGLRTYEKVRGITK